ncbi:hypothetical protein [Anaerophilus nitritogenes]|uniref:hypothetical protein n=1 Tax=Anaerophilus nitritogenes TaxID=2498136 RepID=UPI00101CD245|nr:hypothetical protein [Anaerophilus nitritogenes]
MSGSKGILEGLNKTSKEFKSTNSLEVKNLESEELKVKRSYTLKPSTVKKLQELKVFVYDDPNITFNEIVDEAICCLYDSKKEK